MTEQFGNQQCQCHQCTTIRWKNSLAGQIETATTGALNHHPLGESSQLSRLREGLRDYAKRLSKQAEFFPLDSLQGEILNRVSGEIRALLSLEGDKSGVAASPEAKHGE